jgi:TRAP-type C4-dicarboxylate transport system permease small subunit
MLEFISQAVGLLFGAAFMWATVVYCHAMWKHGDDKND